MSRLRGTLRQMRRYPSAVAGLGVILTLIVIALGTVIAIPYSDALDKWRVGDEWRMHPVNAGPVWADRLLGGNAPTTQVIGGAEAQREQTAFEGGRQVRLTLDLAFTHDDFPSELTAFVTTAGTERPAFIRARWQRPDGVQVPLGGHRISGEDRIAISQDWELEDRLGAPPHIGLFAADDTGDGAPQVLPGEYSLVLDSILFDADATLDAELVAYGRVHGLAGTDHQRRDLMVALLWGTPVALAFGILAAVGTTVTTLVIAAAGVWYGRWVDAIIQRLTEVTMILPILPVLVMVGTLYSTSIWLMLGVVIVLGIFSASIKMYRAMLLPIRSAPYIEAARAYGAGNLRIVMRYIIPRILPVLIPTFVTLIPTYVFLEASLAVLGLGDPVLPTWGKVLNDAQTQGALYNGFYYWVLSPAALLMLTGLGFALFGYALDRIFNPRLRSR